MSARSIRRAAERQALKLTHKTGIADAPPPLPAAMPELAPTPETISPARLSANRENARKSTGPTTLEGKAISALNAVKTGLTGHTVLLPTDDAAAYESHTRAYQESMRPADKEQRDLVLAISDAAWRLQRIRFLEQALFAKGRVEFAAMFPTAEPALRSSLIELHTFEIYEKKLRNLSLQESRICRQREKDVAELRLRQSMRPSMCHERQPEFRPQQPPQPASAPPLGFEFSSPEISAPLAPRPVEKTGAAAFEPFYGAQPAA